jgi:hypothetical protein
MISREKFEIYEDIRESGATNMFDVRTVVKLSEGELTREDCIEIMGSYDNLMELYPDVRK